MIITDKKTNKMITNIFNKAVNAQEDDILSRIIRLEKKSVDNDRKIAEIENYLDKVKDAIND
jgi:hypothetical protein